MMPVEAFFGFLGAAMFVAISFYLKKSLENIEEHQDLSLARFFIDEKGLRSFEVLVVGALIYSVAMLVTAVEFSTDSALMVYTSRGLILVVVTIFLYTTIQIVEVTDPASDQV